MLLRTYLGNPGIMLKIVILTTFMTVCLNPAFAHAAPDDVNRGSETVNIIPLPVSVEQSSPGAPGFVIRASTRFVAEKDAAVEASKLIDVLAPAMGFRL